MLQTATPLERLAAHPHIYSAQPSPYARFPSPDYASFSPDNQSYVDRALRQVHRALSRPEIADKLGSSQERHRWRDSVLPVEDQEAHALYMESALRSQESVSMAVELLAEMYTGSSARVPAAAQRVSALERDLRTTTYKCASPEKKLAMMRTFRAAAYTFLEAIAESAIEMEEEAAA